MSSARVVCLTTAVTRLTHARGTAGNESLAAREAVTDAGGFRREVGWLSGNALRHVCVRAPGMRWLVGEYGLSGQLSLAQLNFLFHGGALTGSTGREPTARVAEMGECLPLLRLLGGALPDQILSGSLYVGPGVLACEENRARLAAILWPDALDGLPPLAPGESFMEAYQYATYDARRMEAGLAESAPDFAASESDPRMLYVGECLRPGSALAHEFTLRDPAALDLGCLLWSLSLWRRGGGVVGGMGAKGHGRTETVALVDGADAPPGELVAAYLDHARKMKGRAVKWLHAAFRRPEKAKKGGRGRKKADAGADA